MRRFERSQRVGEEIQKIVAEVILREIKDYDLSSITITRAEANRDLSEATVHYSVLGDDDARRECTEILRRIAGFVQKRVGDELRLRQIPHIRFAFDKSIAEGARMEELFDQIAREQERDDQS
ncbi:MAG: hypothetical protein Kow0074_13640 [Candidatus Zixiibacteriota bacterium]